jgi:hypothetical protein
MLRYLLFTTIFLTLISCIDPFDVDIYDEEAGGQLVVEGIITNELKSHQVRLRRSAPVGDLSGYSAESGATVSIKNDMGDCYQLFENQHQSGVYFTDSSEFKPAVGNAYQLRITLDNGIEYISDFQTLKSVSPIDTLWIKSEREPYLAGGVVTEGDLLNIYTNVKVGNEVDYYKYDYEGVYELKSFYQGRDLCWDSTEVIPPEILPLDTGRTCFKRENVALPLNIYSTEDLKSVEKLSLKILSIPPSRIFYFGYCMVVRKYGLTEGYHNYLDNIKEQSNFGSDLFSPPPTAIMGNVHELENDDKMALGYFTALNLTSKRIFIDNQILKDLIRDPLNSEPCVYDTIIREPPPPPIFCCDCLLVEGATDQKPEFWPF